MLIKSNSMNNIATHTKFTTFRIGLSIAFGTGTEIGLLYPGPALSDKLGNNALGQQGIFRTQGGK